MTDQLWCMHIAGPDDVHAAPDFWTAVAWSAELNAVLAKKALAEKWGDDEDMPPTQASAQPWPWSADLHAKSLAEELASRGAPATRAAEQVTADDEEAEAVFQSERISAALALYEEEMAEIDPSEPEYEVRVFDAMKAAIEMADHIQRTGQLPKRRAGTTTPAKEA